MRTHSSSECNVTWCRMLLLVAYKQAYAHFFVISITPPKGIFQSASNSAQVGARPNLARILPTFNVNVSTFIYTYIYILQGNKWSSCIIATFVVHHINSQQLHVLSADMH